MNNSDGVFAIILLVIILGVSIWAGIEVNKADKEDLRVRLENQYLRDEITTMTDRMIFLKENVVIIGMASWYGEESAGVTASGEIFDLNLLTAASYYLPFGSKWRVTVVGTCKSVVVRINDRGPHIIGRVIDLSEGAAKVLGIVGQGVVRVTITPEI